MSKKSSFGFVVRLDFDLLEGHKQVKKSKVPRAEKRRLYLINSQQRKVVFYSLSFAFSVVDAYFPIAVFLQGYNAY